MLFIVSKVGYADEFCDCILLNNKQLRILKCFSDAGEMCHSAFSLFHELDQSE